MQAIHSIDEPAARYKVGQTVSCELDHGSKYLAECKIISVLPATAGDVQYRIKSSNESFERMVREYQLNDG